MEDQDPLTLTLSRATRDGKTVDAQGQAANAPLDGVIFRDSVAHTDARGTLCEMYDLRWAWHEAPLVQAYFCTIRPGYAKGWNLHERQDDRYFIVSGRLRVVLYDVRRGSPTYGRVFATELTEQRRRLMRIPAYVWHAVENIGDVEAMLVNFPTAAYDYENPDKFRLPIDTPLIPFKLECAKGW
jgi:dTDP-4-dehydrorhamnose 3,5-epimerase